MACVQILDGRHTGRTSFADLRHLLAGVEVPNKLDDATIEEFWRVIQSGSDDHGATIDYRTLANRLIFKM